MVSQLLDCLVEGCTLCIHLHTYTHSKHLLQLLLLPLSTLSLLDFVCSQPQLYDLHLVIILSSILLFISLLDLALVHEVEPGLFP